MRAIKIDSKECTVTEVELHETDQLEEMQAIVDGYIEQAPYNNSDHDELFVNEEGLINGTNFGFFLGGQIFHGSGVIVGATDDSGNATPAKTTLKTLIRQIRFWK